MIYDLEPAFRRILRENGVPDALQAKFSFAGILTTEDFWFCGRDEEEIKEWINCWAAEEDEKAQDALLLAWRSVRRRMKELSDEGSDDHIRQKLLDKVPGDLIRQFLA